MRRRNSLAAGAIALSLAAALPAAAQLSSTPLAQVDAWGVGWISANDGALPASFWDNTTAETLAPIMAGLQPKDLSPAARDTLRRILLSRGKGPEGGAALTPERLRLMELLGEGAHAADLRKRYPATDWGKTGERQAAEFDLLLGRQDQACAALGGKPATDADLMPLRAACAALNGDSNAGLVAEQIARTDEPLGLWLMSALPAIAAPDMKKPDGRYATPLQAAISVAAKLSVPANAFASVPADIAAAVALNPKATNDQRRAALRSAFAAGKVKPADALAILSLKDESAAAKPPARGAARPDYTALAVAAAANKDAKPEDRAAAYVAALRAAETLDDGRLTSAVLLAAIKALPRNDTTLPYAEPIVRAALLSGDTKLATDWRKHLGTLAKDKQDAWAMARLDLMLSYAGATNEKPGAIIDRMLEAAPFPVQGAAGAAARAPTTGEQQLAVRRIENTRALFLAFGMGRDLSAAQRATLSAQRTAGRGVSDAAIARITAAARQKANAEAALGTLAQLGPDVSALSFAGLADLLTQMRTIGLEDDASAMALESLQVWKAL